MNSRLVQVILMGTLLVSACSSSGVTDAAATVGSTLATATEGAKPELPGTQAFGLTDGEFAENVLATEALIATCMTEAGFEYVPVDVTSVLAVSEWLRSDPAMSRLEYKGEFGFGISTRFDFPARDIGLGLQNLRIYEDLSAADQVAYDRAMFGDDTDATFAITLDDEDFTSTGGCTTVAIDAVFPTEMRTATFVNPKDILVESDPRVVEVNDSYASCMQDAGYDYTDQDDIIDEYEERLDVLTEGDDPESLAGPRLEALRELQSEEIGVALQDLDCQLPVDDVIRQVEIELFGAPVS